MMPQWVSEIAIDTKQSCDQQLRSFIQDPRKSTSFTQDPDGRQMGIFHLLKTESSHT